MMQCYQQKSPLYPLVGCRMTKITLQYGIHENSALGFCGLALAYTIVFKDVSEGYKLGKYALAITTNKNIPAVHMTLGMISIWKEPIQALLPELLNAYNMGLQVRYARQFEFVTVTKSIKWLTRALYFLSHSSMEGYLRL